MLMTLNDLHESMNLFEPWKILWIQIHSLHHENEKYFVQLARSQQILLCEVSASSFFVTRFLWQYIILICLNWFVRASKNLRVYMTWSGLKWINESFWAMGMKNYVTTNCRCMITEMKNLMSNSLEANRIVFRKSLHLAFCII